MKLNEFYIKHLPGNAKKYDLQNIVPAETSCERALNGKRILFLGSSVTYGAASGGISFAEYIQARNNCTCTKEAVSGTTLADISDQSYVSRLKIITQRKIDIFVCQLSTNDASQNIALDKVRSSIEGITDYVKRTYGCPILFFTNPYYKSHTYAKMVKLAHTLSEQSGFTLLDIYNDSTFNNVTPHQYRLYMAEKYIPQKQVTCCG